MIKEWLAGWFQYIVFETKEVRIGNVMQCISSLVTYNSTNKRGIVPRLKNKFTLRLMRDS